MLWGMLGLSSRKSRLCKPQKGRLDAGYIWDIYALASRVVGNGSRQTLWCVSQSSSANVWTASFWKGTILTCSGQELEPYTKYHPFDFEDRICWFKHHMAIHDTSQYIAIHHNTMQLAKRARTDTELPVWSGRLTGTVEQDCEEGPAQSPEARSWHLSSWAGAVRMSGYL